MPKRGNREAKSTGRVKDRRPVDWWRAGVWMVREVRAARAARRLKRRDAIAEKSEVSPPPAKGKVGRPKKVPG